MRTDVGARRPAEWGERSQGERLGREQPCGDRWGSRITIKYPDPIHEPFQQSCLPFRLAAGWGGGSGGSEFKRSTHGKAAGGDHVVVAQQMAMDRGQWP